MLVPLSLLADTTKEIVIMYELFHRLVQTVLVIRPRTSVTVP